jgi:GNAT superfamily N-acetyltransferase
MASDVDELSYAPSAPEVWAFLEDLAARRKTGPFEGVYVYCVAYVRDVAELRNVGVEGAPKGEGRGTAALEALFELADAHGVKILVQPHGEKGFPTERLDAWYRRLGFSDCAQEGRLIYRPGSRHVPRP